MKEETLPTEQGETLVHIARESLDTFVRQAVTYEPDLTALPENLRAPGASFITLTFFGELRGCIGVATAYRPLAIDVARNAIAAASRDPRFLPLQESELSGIRLSVTVLTPSKRLAYTDYASLVDALRPGTDGVTLEWNQRRAILLPQVWRRIPQPERFLRSLCLKASIPEEELHKPVPEVAAYTFQVQHFYEPGYLEPGGLAPDA